MVAVANPDHGNTDLSRAPVYAADGTPASCLHNRYKGEAVFLVCGGPSLLLSPLALLNQRGICVAAVNNVAATNIRPHLWFSCDPQYNFHEIIWRDPAVMKFTKLKYTSSKHKWAGSKNGRPHLHRWDGSGFVPSHLTPADCPNTWGYYHADFKTQPWNPATYFTSPLPSWGSSTTENDPDGKSWHKSVLLVTLWMLYWLGFRTINLLSCDFSMSKDKQYAFPEDGREGPNNELYRWLDRRFSELAPHLPALGVEIVNCTVGGSLTAFPRRTLEEAVSLVVGKLPREIVTKGHYRG